MHVRLMKRPQGVAFRTNGCSVGGVQGEARGGSDAVQVPFTSAAASCTTAVCFFACPRGAVRFTRSHPPKREIGNGLGRGCNRAPRRGSLGERERGLARSRHLSRIARLRSQLP